MFVKLKHTFPILIRRAALSVNNILSNIKESPTFFNIFVSDLSTLDGIFIAMYADEIAIIFRNSFPIKLPTAVAFALEEFDSYFSRWGLKLNTNKTRFICFSRKRINNPRNLVSFNNFILN